MTYIRYARDRRAKSLEVCLHFCPPGLLTCKTVAVHIRVCMLIFPRLLDSRDGFREFNYTKTDWNSFIKKSKFWHFLMLANYIGNAFIIIFKWTYEIHKVNCKYKFNWKLNGQNRNVLYQLKEFFSERKEAKEFLSRSWKKGMRKKRLVVTVFSSKRVDRSTGLRTSLLKVQGMRSLELPSKSK